MIRRLTLAQVSEQLGLDESEVRFLLLHFREFMRSASTNEVMLPFSDGDLKLLQRIYRMVIVEEIDPADVRALLRAEQTGSKKSGNCQGGILAFTSGRPGSGKSSIIWNLSAALAARGYRTVIYDGAAGTGGITGLLTGQPDSLDSDWELRFPSGVVVIAGEKLLMALDQVRDTDAEEVIMQRLQEIESSSDYVLLDTGQGRSDSALRYGMVADEIIEVTTTDVGANADCFAIIRMLYDVDPDVQVSLVINRAISLGEAREAYSRINGAAQKVSIGAMTSLGWVAEDEMLRTCMARGETVVEAMGTSTAARCIGRLADQLTNRLTPIRRRNSSAMIALTEALRQSLERRQSSYVAES